MSTTKTKKRSSIKKKEKKEQTYSGLIFKHRKDNPRYSNPKELYESLNHEFHFTFQPNLKTLGHNWGKRVFVNTPFKDPNVWVERGLEEVEKGHTETAVFLLKGDISTALFHDLVIPYAKELRAIRGRLSFSGKGNSPYGSIVAIFSKSRHGERKKQDPRLKTHKEKAVIESVTEQKTNGSENKV